jgi:hypothetical protein
MLVIPRHPVPGSFIGLRGVPLERDQIVEGRGTAQLPLDPRQHTARGTLTEGISLFCDGGCDLVHLFP